MRKKQIFQGVVKKFVLSKLNILIISESWPSVIVGLESNLANKFWVHSKNIPDRLRDLLPNYITWIGEAEVSRIRDKERIDLVLLQGSGKYCEQVLNTFGQDLAAEKVYVIMPSQRIRSYKRLRATIGKWYKLKHEDIGGVTNSRWLLGAGKQKHGKMYLTMDNLCATIGLNRHFSDVLKTATRGKVCDPPEKPMPALISLESISSSSEFYVPCVMSRSGWVSRPLIPQELGAIFDYPELYMSYIASNKLELTSDELDLLFNINTVPIKIVGMFTQ